MLTPTLAAFMLAVTGIAIRLVYRGGVATATITHSAEIIFFRMLKPGMRSRITRPPIVDCVALETVSAKRRSVPARVAVTSHAGGRRPFKDHVLVATSAFHARVPAREREF